MTSLRGRRSGRGNPVAIFRHDFPPPAHAAGCRPPGRHPFLLQYLRIRLRSAFRKHDPLLASDNARLDPARVAAVNRLETVEALQAALADARAKGLKVSMAGSHHSQGGQTYTAGGVQFDMRGFRKVLAIDTVEGTITVESGATWDEVQRALAPVGLAIKVMQSSNIFTVGGTMSANAHGRDIDVMQMVQVVDRFHLLKADGEVVEVSRVENPELFSLVIGGYGMYGVILDVTLEVTKDELYEQRAASVDYRDFPAYFKDSVQVRHRRGVHAGAAVDRSRSRQVPAGNGGGDLAPGAGRRAGELRPHRGGQCHPRPLLPRHIPEVRLGQEAEVVPAEEGGARSGRAAHRLAEQRDAAAAGTARAAPVPVGQGHRHPERVLCAGEALRAVHGQVPPDPARQRHERDELDGAVREPRTPNRCWRMRRRSRCSRSSR